MDQLLPKAVSFSQRKADLRELMRKLRANETAYVNAGGNDAVIVDRWRRVHEMVLDEFCIYVRMAHGPRAKA